MNQIGGELHHIAPPRALGGQRHFDIAEDLDALRIEITDTDGVALLIGRQRTRDEQEFGCFHPRDLRVLPQWRAQAIRVVDFDIGGHVCLPSFILLSGPSLPLR